MMDFVLTFCPAYVAEFFDANPDTVVEYMPYDWKMNGLSNAGLPVSYT